MTPDATRALYLRISRLYFDDALVCGVFTLVYAPDDTGEGYASYTLYRGRDVEKRWRLRRAAGLPCVQRKVIAHLEGIGGAWAYRHHYGARFAWDELGAPPRPVPAVTMDFAPRQQLTLWAAA